MTSRSNRPRPSAGMRRQCCEREHGVRHRQPGRARPGAPPTELSSARSGPPHAWARRSGPHRPLFTCPSTLDIEVLPRSSGPRGRRSPALPSRASRPGHKHDPSRVSRCPALVDPVSADAAVPCGEDARACRPKAALAPRALRSRPAHPGAIPQIEIQLRCSTPGATSGIINPSALRILNTSATAVGATGACVRHSLARSHISPRSAVQTRR